MQWTLPAVKLSVEWEVDWFPCLQTFLGQWERSIGVNQSSLWLESGQPFELTVAVHHLPDELLFMSQELSGGRGGRLLDRLCQFCFCLAINSTVCQKKCWHIGNIREKNRLPYCQVFLFLIWLPGNRFHKNVVFNWSVPSITVMPKKIRKNLCNKTFLYSYLPFVYDQRVWAFMRIVLQWYKLSVWCMDLIISDKKLRLQNIGNHTNLTNGIQLIKQIINF